MYSVAMPHSLAILFQMPYRWRHQRPMRGAWLRRHPLPRIPAEPPQAQPQPVTASRPAWNVGRRLVGASHGAVRVRCESMVAHVCSLCSRCLPTGRPATAPRRRTRSAGCSGMRQSAAFTVLQGVSAMGSVCPMTCIKQRFSSVSLRTTDC